MQQIPPTTEATTEAPAPVAERAAPPRAAASAEPAARTVAATPPPEPSIPEEVPEPAPPGDVPPPIPPVPPVIDQSVDANPATDPLSENSSTDTAVWLGLLASALGVLGLGFLGALALRRRQVRRVDQVPLIERPKVATDPATPAPTTGIAGTTVDTPRRSLPEGMVTTSMATTLRHDAPVVSDPETSEQAGQAMPADATQRLDQPVSQIREPGPNLAPAGAAVALPRSIPATYDEREALLQRLVEAKPDRANPFHSPLARRRRARLIMQSLGRRFENGKSRIDLSQYPQNWPELQRNRPAAA